MKGIGAVISVFGVSDNWAHFVRKLGMVSEIWA